MFLLSFIRNALRSLVPFVFLKNLENTNVEVLCLVKLRAVFHIFKIAQSVLYRAKRHIF